MYGQLQFPVENSGPRVRNMGWHRGDAAGGLEGEPVLAPDAASGLSGPSGKEIGGRACSSDLQSSEIWVLDVISSIHFLLPLVFAFWSCKDTRVNGVLGLCKFWCCWLPLLFLRLLRCLRSDLLFWRLLPFSFLKSHFLLLQFWSICIQGLFG